MNLGVKSWPGSAAHSSVTGSWEVNSRASGIKEKEQNRWLGRLNQASLLKSTISNILFPWENEINSAEISQSDEVNKVVLHKGNTASQECYRPSTWRPGDWQPWPCMVIRVPFSGSETIAPPGVLAQAISDSVKHISGFREEIWGLSIHPGLRSGKVLD